MPVALAQNEFIMSSHEELYSKGQQTIQGTAATVTQDAAKATKAKKTVSWAPVLYRRHQRKESLNLSCLGSSTKEDLEQSMSFSNILGNEDPEDEDEGLSLGASLTRRVANLTAQLTDDEDSDVLLDGMPEFGQFIKPDFSRAASDNGFNRRSGRASLFETDMGSFGTLNFSLAAMAETISSVKDSDEKEEKALHLLVLGDKALTEERWSEALAWYKQAVRHQRDIFDPGDNRIHQTLISIAECHANLGDSALALSTLQDCLRVQIAAFGENHEDVMLTKTYIAQLTTVRVAEEEDSDEFDFSGIQLGHN
jgi:tetratricopeptide (TPR) repeat protein